MIRIEPRGFALLGALIALLILAFSMLGLSRVVKKLIGVEIPTP
jgi:Tfp pilus assembly protein PilV